MCHVLIIEDEPLIAMQIEMMLGDAGATSFDFAVTEQDAVDSAMARCPELITSDVKLLEGTGPCAVKRILEDCGPLPVIFITATPEACEPCHAPTWVLTKPIRASHLAEAFRELDPIGRSG